MNYSSIYSLFQVLCRIMIPFLGLGVSLYPALIIGSNWLIVSLITFLLLTWGVVKNNFFHIKISVILLLILYGLTLSNMGMDGYFYGALMGIVCYIIVELGYTLQLKKDSNFSNSDKDKITRFLLWPTVKRIMIVMMLTLGMVILLFALLPLLENGIINPITDLFVLSVLLVYVMFLIYKRIRKRWVDCLDKKGRDSETY